MSWTLWAALLITHGAFAYWAKTVSNHALAAIFADGLLIAIGLVTIEQLQGLGVLDVVRIGLFFAAFGASGRQLMNSLLRKYADTRLPRVSFF